MFGVHLQEISHWLRLAQATFCRYTWIMAQGVSAIDSAKLGVYLQGLSAELASESLGLRAALARDLCDYISAAFVAMGDTNG